MTIGFKANNDGSGAIQVNGVDRATVDTSGNVGIGTSSPASALSFGVSRGLNATAGVPTLRMYDDGTNSFGIAASSSGVSALDISCNFGGGNIRLFTGGNTASPVERARIASDGQQSSVIPGGSVLYPEYKCRAWVNFNGTGTVAIRASGNVSSITDNGTGDYTVNFTTAMPDANYTTQVTSDTNLGANANIQGGTYPGGTYSTTAVRIFVQLGSSGGFDRSVVNASIFR